MSKATSLNYKIICTYTISFILHTVFKLEDEFLLRGGE